MLKRFVKFICVVLCLAMLLPFAAIAEGGGISFGGHPGPQEATPHTDITDGSWYENGCKFVYHKGVMVGTSETEFSPHMKMTREMAVVTIASFIGDFDDSDYSDSSFKDVEAGRWYSQQIQWAYKVGIVDGIGDGYFGLGQPITRQDFISMLFKTVNLNRYYSDPENPPKYEGDESISDYAKAAARFFINFDWYTPDWGTFDAEVVGVPQIIDGYPDGLYHFKDTLTRAQAATMLSVFLYQANSKYPNYPIKDEFETVR